MTVAELLSRISSRELTEWMCYFGLEGPAGEERADWRAGMIAATIANVNRDPKKRARPFTPGDFMPKWGEEPRVQTPEQQAAMARVLAKALGGEIRVDE